MIRIAGVNISKNKHIMISLTYVFGIGKSISKKICDKFNINYNTKINNIDLLLIDKIREEIIKYNIEGDLKRFISINIKRLIDIGSYRGYRHKKHLPVRGQRTRTNAKTNKKYTKYKKNK